MPGRPPLRLAALARTLDVASRHAWFVEAEVGGLRQLVGPGGVCLDVGAEYGLYTWSLASLVGPAGAVHAVEPQPDLGRLLAFGRRLVGARNVTIHHLALSARPGEGHLSQPSLGPLRIHGRTFLADGTSGLGSNAEFRRHRTIAAVVDTLDALAHRLGLARLDLIKADVEGAEGRLLDGGQETLERLRPSLLLELEDRHLSRFDTSVSRIVGGLRDLGYRPAHWAGGRWRPGIAGRNVLFRRAPHDEARG